MILDNMIINCKVLAINRTNANKAVDKSFVISGNLIDSTFLRLRQINNIQYTNNILIDAYVEVIGCNFAKITNNKILGNKHRKCKKDSEWTHRVGKKCNSECERNTISIIK